MTPKKNIVLLNIDDDLKTNILKIKKLDKKEEKDIIDIAKRTWGFFGSMMNDTNNYLPTDNFQENRRYKIANEKKIVIGDVVLDYESFTVTGHGQTQELPQKEFLLLYKLIAILFFRVYCKKDCFIIHSYI